MKTFNINRFWQVFIRLLLVRRREMVKWFLAMGGIVLFILLLSAHVWDFTPYTNEEQLYHYLGSMTVIGSILFIMILNYGSYIASDLEKKQARISELMLPGASIEKYIARLLYSSVVFILMAFVALLCADVLQQGITMLVHRGARVSLIGLYWEEVGPFLDRYQLWNILSAYLFVNATAVLGGVIFRRAAWLKTWIAVGIITTFSLFLGFLFVTYIYTQTAYEVYMPVSKETMQVLFNLGLVITSFVFYWLAYKIYSRLQVINNRWINL